MKTTHAFITVVALALALPTVSCAAGGVAFKQGPDRIDVLIDGQNVTSYRYDETLTKPILYPLKTPGGMILNRGYPLVKVEGESTDHPHHVGLFFTYDEVNDSGFWNNTTSPPQIHHVKTVEMTGGEKGTLKTLSQWIDKSRKPILEEHRTMVFHPGPGSYAIDLTIDLKALAKVEFGDTKEGMLGIRTADWLRERDGHSEYLASTGARRAGNIWGRRATWVTLQGEKDGRTVGIAILNHPSSVNYPTYWHARDYGLFSANPLGQLAFDKAHKVPDAKAFGLALEPGQAAHFRFLIIVYEGAKTKEQLDAQFEKFARQ
ncbi:MAG TPA: hypothetical protein ENN87_06615 [Phycisphaerales bacterium]|nr:hypothetical protein [Phycisphaerales bacterium]